MPTATESLPDDANALKAMLIAERVQNERLRQIIKEMQRHRFGRRAVAQVLVSKYADHLPLYRQAQIYARQGVILDRSTMADWVGRAAWLLRPIHERMFAALKRSGKLFADETTAPVLDPGRGRTKTGQLWAYASDDRPWGGTDPRKRPDVAGERRNHQHRYDPCVRLASGAGRWRSNVWTYPGASPFCALFVPSILRQHVR